MTDHEKRFHGKANRLRSPERIRLLEVDRVVALTTEGLKASRLIDIGTGTGIFAQAFAAIGLSVIGIDANPALLTLARETVPGVRFDEAPAEAIPFEERAFDIAFLGHVLHETDDPVKALMEAHRVSTTLVAVLEWPYVQEEQGPPLAHRLEPAIIVEMAKRVGFKGVERLKLRHMDLYRMSLAPRPS
jgi:ubiquinone/menaquinone biosynthesis C-methylase UbiE